MAVLPPKPNPIGKQQPRFQFRTKQPPIRWLFSFVGEIMCKEEITAAIRACAEKLGRGPSFIELNRMMQITRAHYREHFANYTEAIRESGCEARGGGHRIDLGRLLKDWAEVTRKLRKLPTLAEYQLHGRYSQRRWWTASARGERCREGSRTMPS